jgi:hypothetical protein
MGEKDSIDLNPIPEILDAKILVRPVLIIVVVDDRYADDGSTEHLLKEIHGDAAA